MVSNCVTAEDIIKTIEDQKVQMVDLRFTDLPGVWQHFSVPPSAVNANSLNDGLGFDGSSIRGFQAIQESDMLVVPDPTTAFLDPFAQATTLVLICNIRDPVTGQPYSRDARYIAQKAEAYLKGTGRADTSYFGPEAEFFVFNDVRYGQGINYAFHEIDSSEGSWNTGKEEAPNLGHKPRPKEGYFPVPPTDSMQDLRTEMVLTMESLGIQIEAHHHEVATGGQNEIDMRFTTLTRMADNLMIYKYVVKNTARRHSMTATFMPKPLFEDNASGMHVHQKSVEWRDQPVPRQGGLCRAERAWPLLHRRVADACLGVMWALRPDHELLSASGAGLRSADQPGLFPAQPLGLLPDSDVFAGPAGEARRVPFAGPLVQSLPGLRRDADGRPRRHREPH